MFSRLSSETIYLRFHAPYREVPERTLTLILDEDPVARHMGMQWGPLRARLAGNEDYQDGLERRVMERPSIGEKGTTPSPSAVRNSRKLDAVDNAGADFSRPPDNLPRELSSFIGREREISEVKRLLGDNRLLTLCGTGGCGKTRLALAVAQDLLEGFEDGVWWVGLASLSDPDLVPRATASALGVREVADRPLTEVLMEHLKPRKTLLVLDNCEHLVEECAALADTLLRTCPKLRILATSREPLRVAGESNWLVPSLSLPDSRRLLPTGELERYEAVRLFVERAKAVDVGFALTERNASAVAQLCQKLDGIPLAIELAAARVRVLSVEQISEKLEDPLRLLTTGSRTAAPRHQTLRATLQWSHELLSEAEQALFRRLSVFFGGWDLEAAEAVGAGEGIEQEDILDLLGRLMDKSLVVAEKSGEKGASFLRYRMLEPVRQYALERLAEGGEAEETHRRHAAFFVALAEEAEPKLTTAEQVTWLEWLEADHNNLRTALRWSLDLATAETALRLVGALWRFWYVRGYSSEGRRWLEEALALDGGEPSLRARVLSGGGELAHSQGDLDRAEELREEALAVSRRLGDEVQIAAALNGLAFVLRRKGEFTQARAMHQEALELYRKLDDRWGVARSTDLLGRAAAFQGDYAVALPRLEEGLRMWREIGDREGIAESTALTGMVALGKRDYRTARSLLQKARATMEELGNPRGIAKMTVVLADIDLNDGDQGAAQALYEEALALLKYVDDKWWMAWCLEGMAEVAVAQRRTERAIRLFGAAEALRVAIGAPRPAGFRDYFERDLVAARDSLDEAAFENAWEEGRTMTPEQAIEYALGGRMEESYAAAPATTTPLAPESPTGISDRPAETVLAEAKGPPEPLRIFALGPARVEKEGRPLTSSPDWIHKPRELLFYLLSHPEGGRTKEQIGLALWSEASTAQLRSSLHDTVYRLRRALGAKEWIVFQKGRYSFNRSLSYFFDVEAFEENLSEVRGVHQAQAPEQAIGHLKEATELYRGDFIEDSADSEWAVVRQEELRRAYQEALLLLGGLLYGQERYAQAADAYRKAISHDRFLEEAHRELMRCQAALGERGRAIRHYEDLVELLQEQLATAPAPETSELYERLRAGEEV